MRVYARAFISSCVQCVCVRMSGYLSACVCAHVYRKAEDKKMKEKKKESGRKKWKEINGENKRR